MKTLSPADARLLTRFLASPDRPDDTLQYWALHGFLFSVVCSPVSVRPAEWLPMVFGGETAHFDSERQEQKIHDLIARLYSIINAAFVDEVDELPDGCEFLPAPLANFDDDAPVALWSQGFERGHQWLGPHWEAAIAPGSLDDAAGAAATLTFFASREETDAMLAEGDKEVDTDELTEICRSVQQLFEHALGNYADVKRTQDARIEADHPAGKRRPHGALDLIEPAADDPCPCGSGQKYQRCCGAKLH